MYLYDTALCFNERVRTQQSDPQSDDKRMRTLVVRLEPKNGVGVGAGINNYLYIYIYHILYNMAAKNLFLVSLFKDC